MGKIRLLLKYLEKICCELVFFFGGEKGDICFYGKKIPNKSIIDFYIDLH